MDNWVAIKTVYLNTNRITGFEWRKGKLMIWDCSPQPFTFDDKDRNLYKKLCNACCVNMVQEGQDG